MMDFRGQSPYEELRDSRRVTHEYQRMPGLNNGQNVRENSYATLNIHNGTADFGYLQPI